MKLNFLKDAQIYGEEALLTSQETGYPSFISSSSGVLYQIYAEQNKGVKAIETTVVQAPPMVAPMPQQAAPVASAPAPAPAASTPVVKEEENSNYIYSNGSSQLRSDPSATNPRFGMRCRRGGGAGGIGAKSGTGGAGGTGRSSINSSIKGS